jgi:HEAT repeat protein
MVEQAQLLDDEAMARFVRDGYVMVQTGLPRSFHDDLRKQVEAVLDAEGNWGNNILPRVPELQHVWDDPVVHGALTSVLGPTYVGHPHRYAHLNVPGSTAQRLHKDSLEFSGDRHLRHHRCRWAIAFYYPQDVSEDMGPTAIVPRSQYYLHLPDERQFPELHVCAPAGSVAIVNFDIWHRATANVGDRRRLMVKFEFARMDEPAQPAWRAEPGAWREPDGGSDAAPHGVVWSHLWRWMHGRGGTRNGAANGAAGSANGDAGKWIPPLRAADVPARRRASDALGLLGPAAREALPALAQALRDADEPVRLNAAYALGEIGEPAVPALTDALRAGPEDARRAAGYGLAAAGEPAVEALLGMAGDGEEQVRLAAVDALGDLGRTAAPAVPVLARALRDESEWVRRHAAEALGFLGAPAGAAAPALAEALRDERPYVRFNAATALARIGPAAAAAVPALVQTLGDADRYARGWAALALRRIGTAEAQDALLDHLMPSRWCPITTPQSRY